MLDAFVADVNTFIANVDGWPGNELLHFVLRLTTERATQSVIGSSYHRHPRDLIFRIPISGPRRLSLIGRRSEICSCSSLVTSYRLRSVRDFSARKKLAKTIHALIANEGALPDHAARHSASSLWRARNNLCYFASGFSTERATQALSCHPGNHRSCLQIAAPYSRWAITSSIKP